MPTVSLDAINNGDAADATPVNSNFQELQTAINGLDANNWAAGKILAPSKLTQENAASGEALVWNGTDWAHSTIGLSGIAQGGAVTGAALKWSGSAWTPTAVFECLGMVLYNPTTVTSASTTSTTGADVDATNLSLTVAVPSTGKIAVLLSAGSSASAATTSTMWGLRESTTDIFYYKVATFTDPGGWRVMMSLLYGGITPGTHTYKWAFRTIGSGTAYCRYGVTSPGVSTDPGPASMAIFAVP